MSDIYTAHYSVLKEECIHYLTENASAEGRNYYADLTFGGGGHSFALLESSDNAHVFSTDQDPDALANGKKRIEQHSAGSRLNLLPTNFEKFPEIIAEKYAEEIEQYGGFQGIMMDLGVSSHHFDEGRRGFSFRFDAPLDMRMNSEDSNIQTAADLVNNYSAEDLEALISDYGEEIFAKQIVQNIISKRNEAPIQTTKDLEDIIFHSYPKKMRFGKASPSTKTFQALRIAVNRELDVLESTIARLYPLLRPGGRLAIISFHSLEDRIVKREYKNISDNGEFLCRILTKKPIVPTERELSENSRSRSAKLRVIECINEEMLSPKELKKRKYQGMRNGNEK
ncbi:MAG: 16S rRNA (cytosine(1402)-N(4))-methyltransferase RsmH [Bacteriovoracaceae bacterium]|nr:16S rRNA (cytosine(1402)-N(4))-methyltransferase RsmH [Bacteriovoracaceae bacterium]